VTNLDAVAIRELCVGIGLFVLFTGLGAGALYLAVRVGGVLERLDRTIADLDRQLASLSSPIVDTLSHVGGIADTADVTVAKIGNIVGALETVAGSLGKTANLAQSAVAPSLVNLGAALTGITAGLRRLVRGPDAGRNEARGVPAGGHE
jgi:hypothetical protein